jgi:hypothetical protein
VSKYADEGTIAHQLAAMCLEEGTDAAAYIGRLIEAEDYEHAKLSPSSAKRWMTCAGSHALIQRNKPDFEERFFSMEVTEDMAEHVQVYLDMVRERIETRKLAGAVSVDLLVEQSLPIDHLTHEENATGTGDVVIVSVWEDGTAMLDLIDLKFGMGVEVVVEDNEQLQMYGSGALRNLDLLYDFTRACLTVHQPRIKAEPSDWEVDISVIREFEKRCEFQARHAIHILKEIPDDKLMPYLQPGDHCRTTFCDERANCPKLAEFVRDTAVGESDASVADDFEALVDPEVCDSTPLGVAYSDDELGVKMAATDIIEDWCKQVRAETERRLLAGTPVPGYKLVQGRAGARAWTDAKEVEETFKSMRLKQDEMYDFKLISPTTAEKLLKETPKRWNRVQPLISRSEGKPSVAPESDKRPALTITPTENDFENLEADLAG